MLEVEDLTSVSALEEQQETMSEVDVEQVAVIYNPRFTFFTKLVPDELELNYCDMQLYKIYPFIQLPIIYSPPELS